MLTIGVYHNHGFAFGVLQPGRERGFLTKITRQPDIGQLWDFLGLPSWRFGEADFLPAVLFALLLQPLARFVPTPGREPGEPGASNSE